MDRDIIDFMRENQFNEQTIKLFEDERITKESLSGMDNRNLERLVPSFRHRLLLRTFCRNIPQASSSKLSALEKLALKVAPSAGVSRPSCSKNAEKESRMVEVGLAVYIAESKLFKAVRANKGGGTRKLSIEKQAPIAKVLEECKGVFFPEGKSPIGDIDDFECALLDFKFNTIEEGMSVGGLYEKTKLKMLRFYLALSEVGEESSSDIEEVEELPSVSLDGEEIQFGPFQHGGDISLEDTVVFHTSTPIHLMEGDVVLVGAEETAPGQVPIVAPETVTPEPVTPEPVTPEPVTPKHRPKKTIIIHRENVLKDMVQAFEDADSVNWDVEIEVILPNGEKERATGIGVFRDILSAFWKQFESSVTLGKSLKVPFLRHDYQSKQWESVGRILVRGYQELKYLPTFLAPVFMEYAINGKEASKPNLLQSFLQYVSEQEREVFQVAMDDFEKADYDELIDVLDIYQCKVTPTAENIHRILEEISTKELIQSPAFVADCWRDLLQPLQDVDLTHLYSSLKPTVRRVLDHLSLPESMNGAETTTVSHLRRFIRNLTEVELGLFLRYCTGCDLLVSEHITVQFSKMTGLERRPIAHTCGCVLELPVTYESFPEFRSEFMAILNSGIWTMEIL